MDTGGAAPMDVVAQLCTKRWKRQDGPPFGTQPAPERNKKRLSKLEIIVAAFQYLLRNIFTDENTNRTNHQIHQPASVNVKKCPLLMVNPHFCWYNAQVCRSPLRFLRGLHPVILPPASWLLCKCSPPLGNLNVVLRISPMEFQRVFCSNRMGWRNNIKLYSTLWWSNMAVEHAPCSHWNYLQIKCKCLFTGISHCHDMFLQPTKRSQKRLQPAACKPTPTAPSFTQISVR